MYVSPFSRSSPPSQYCLSLRIMSWFIRMEHSNIAFYLSTEIHLEVNAHTIIFCCRIGKPTKCIHNGTHTHTIHKDWIINAKRLAASHKILLSYCLWRFCSVRVEIECVSGETRLRETGIGKKILLHEMLYKLREFQYPDLIQ